MELLIAHAKRWLAAATLASLAACAHLPPPPPSHGPRWPPPPAAPIIRWAGTFPDPRFEVGKPSTLRKVWSAIVGLEPEPNESPAQLQRPFGIAALEDGFVVADPDGRAVLRVDWRWGKFERVACPGHDWQLPMAVAVGPGGVLFVADAAAGVVVRVDARGDCQRLGAGSLVRPAGVAVGHGRLYVVDPPRHEVVAFSLDGQEELRFGREGDHRLNFPTTLAVTPAGVVLVVDSLNFRVARFTLEGAFLGEFGQAGDGDGAFGRPKGIAVDSEGRIFVTDAEFDVVVMFSAAEKFVVAAGGSGSAPGTLALPAGVAVHEGYLYVANSYNQRVEIYVIVRQVIP